MRFDILTLFPELFDSYLNASVLGRAVKRSAFDWKTFDIRKHAVDDYGHVDDTLYGGGTGMLMMADPIYSTWKEAVNEAANIKNVKRRSIYLSPKGRVFNQTIAQEYCQYDQIILLCGHYEGVDQRVLDEIIDEELSLGDFVITGGELAAMCVIDACARMIPDVLPSADAFEIESHYQGTLEHRQYTKPSVWHGRNVPPVLLEGHHQKIAEFKRMDALNETLLKRPDLFDKIEWEDGEFQHFLEYREELLSKE